MPRFITNQDKLLADVLENYIPNSKQLDFLVGYFYFSGFNGIYKRIKEHKLRILVGMEADVTVNNAIRVWTEQDPNSTNFVQSIEKTQIQYQDNTIKVLNKANEIDTKEGEESFRFFIEKLENGTLEVRKTKEPAHAKMYVFINSDDHNENGEYPGKVLVGSSNLSFHGLQNF